MSVVSEEKQRSDRSPLFHSNSSEVKRRNVCRQLGKTA